MGHYWVRLPVDSHEESLSIRAKSKLDAANTYINKLADDVSRRSKVLVRFSLEVLAYSDSLHDEEKFIVSVNRPVKDN